VYIFNSHQTHHQTQYDNHQNQLTPMSQYQN
jgi:hypothetical protein